jgi:hypothetical protein
VIFDHHQVALGELRIHAAAGVADDKRVAAQRFHDAHRQRDLLERVAFVKVKTPFHGDDALAGEAAAHQPSGVPRRRRYGEVRDIAVVQRRLRLDLLDQPAQSGAENNADLRPAFPSRLNRLLRFLDLFVQLCHEFLLSAIRYPPSAVRYSLWSLADGG